MKKASIAINNYDSHLVISVNDQSNLVDHVPAMVYKVALSREGILMIKDRPTFTLPQLRFGKHKEHYRRITSTYDRCGKGNGVLLSGMKGTGKSLMAEELGNWMIAQDLPVIMITEALDADALAIILKAVGPCMVYFDEFGKIYHDEHRREALLPLFSDTSYEGVMFVITGNETREFSEYLTDRPQRFRYAINYDKAIDSTVIEDILQTMKIPEQLRKAFRVYCEDTPGLNFDSLMCVIRESAGCKTPVEVADLCEILNVPPFPRMSWHVSAVKMARDVIDEAFAGLGYSVTLQVGGIGTDRLRVVESDKIEHTRYSYPHKSDSEVIETYVLKDLAPEEGSRTIRHSGYRELDITLTYGYPTYCPEMIRLAVPSNPQLGKITQSSAFGNHHAH